MIRSPHEHDRQITALLNEGAVEAAFNGIVSAYSERLYWHVRRIVGSHEDTDDLLQEIFIKVWAALPSFRGESRLFTWLWRIATNESLNFVRHRKLRAALSFRSLAPEDERRMDHDPYFNGTEAERLLVKAIASLPKTQRMVFIMRYYEDMKYEEISEILGSSVSSLKASYHFAYNKIKAELKDNF